MASGPPPPSRRPPAGSRVPTSRARRVADRIPEPAAQPEPDQPQPDQPQPDQPQPDATAVGRSRRAASTAPATESATGPVRGAAATGLTAEDRTEPIVLEQSGGASKDGRSRLAGSATTAVLGVVVLLLACLVAAEAWYLWGRDDPTVSSDRPVVAGKVAYAAAVEAAATAAEAVSTASYQSYDQQVERAAALMTDTFAQKFRQTKGDVKEQFVARRTKVTAQVQGQGVVQASPEQVVALIFLDQNTTRRGTGLQIAQYRLLVTMVRADAGWLVDEIKTI